MKSLRARISLWFALSATITLAVLFAVGYLLLESHMQRDLDLLNKTEFEQIRARLGTDYGALTPQIVDQRIHETADYASVLFYVNIDEPPHDMLFYSNNLDGKPIPDVPGKHIYNAFVPGVGELRVGEFIMPPFDVTIGTPTRQMRQDLTAYVEVCIALLVIMLLTSGLIGIVTSRLILRPVRLIGETANRIRSDNLAERIAVPGGKDEIFDLVRLLNQMFDRLEASFKQARQFSEEVSHELKTPLSLVRLHAERLLVEGKLERRQEDAVLVQLDELARINQMIDELLFISRAEVNGVTLNLINQHPGHFLRSVEPDLHALVEHRGRRLRCVQHGDGLVAMEEKWLRQVIFNLLTNALRVSPPNGLITMTSIVADGSWCVSTEDEGPGLTDEQCERVFDRFVRFNVRAGEDQGSGLGLTICRSIIELHGGSIRAQPRGGELGLRVSFSLPVATVVESSYAMGQPLLGT
ncbi:sensor histidine kinase [Dyella nitratireducens]|uniref:histidine kinase n=1 Tax=Dyella nitratireducens TaxID=1849580 RepID=A0ABQ1G6S4_9GAMM|nr:ATP-binding protein [Dyella nitratireducens]GGA37818.1 two-component sensor histidine kinase [Dyella nitratireducens]GLQ40232.1 two-component sensor histidine kinase [Dyella nitratireducens]